VLSVTQTEYKQYQGTEGASGTPLDDAAGRIPAPALPPGVLPIYIADTLVTSPESRAGERPATETRSYSFEPIPDSDEWKGDINKIRTGGEIPSYHVKGLGSQAIRHGGKLFLKTSLRRVIDAQNALSMARMKCPDLRFFSPPLPRVAKLEDLDQVAKLEGLEREQLEDLDQVEARSVPELPPSDPFGGVALTSVPRPTPAKKPARKASAGHQLGFDFGGSDA
jgi:hypothetical protein